MILISGIGHLYYKLEYETKICNIRSFKRINNVEIHIFYTLLFNNVTYHGRSIIYDNYNNTTISCNYNKYTSEISLEKNNTSILSASLLCLTISSYSLLSGIIILIIQILYIKFYKSTPALETFEVDINILDDEISIETQL